MAVIKT